MYFFIIYSEAKRNNYIDIVSFYAIIKISFTRGKNHEKYVLK